MDQWEWPAHKCGMALEHNPHKDNYETVNSWMSHDADGGCPAVFENVEMRIRCVDTNEIWTLQWYPKTPIGSYYIAAPTFEDLIRFANSSSFLRE